MAPRRPLPPWWIWIPGGLLVLHAAVFTYSSHVIGPLGWTLWDRVRTVQPGSPADLAGVEAGDLIRGEDLDRLLQTIRPGGEYRIAVQRGKEARVLTLRSESRGWAYWRSSKGFQSLLAMGSALLSLVLSGVLVFNRPRDRTALWAALLLAQFAALAGAGMPFGAIPEKSALIHQLPFPLDWAATAGWWLTFTGGPAALTFLGRFPREPFRGRLLAIIWAPAVLTLPLSSSISWMALTVSTLAAYLVVAAALLVRNYWHFTDRKDQRRTKVVVIGFAVGAAAGVIFLLLSAPWRPFEQFRMTHLNWLSWTWPILVSATPICIAYAILRHRVFDVHVLVRLGLRYAAARGLLLSLVPLVGLALVVDVLLHGGQPLGDILVQRGWRYGLLALAAWALHARQEAWLGALDRRFFREHYDAQQLLLATVSEVRAGEGLDRVASHVTSRVESALHPEFVTVVLRDPIGARYRVVASTGVVSPPLPAGSKLVSLVRVLGRPVEVPPDEHGWLARQLPAEEWELARRSRIEWLFPICVGDGGTEALLLLGPKRSEEPYSKEDQNLLDAIAGSLAMLLERSAPAAPKVGFEECPECGSCYEPGEGLCTHDGVSLSRVATSRTVDGRYRLDRRLGQGGMGTVYEAFDGELERRVALKLIRPELVAGADAAARFKWEAKAAAAFTHPNVVTVHDFGVAEDGRAYTVMELLEGRTLRQELERHTRLEAARALAVLRGVCAAVSAAHERGLLHRDLKPENIFLTRSGAQESAKILDFGLVKQLAGFGDGRESMETTAGVLVGTLRYMAPEQLRGGSPSPGWDLWALAIVAYEMLVGTYPFGAPQEIGQLMAPRTLSPVSDRLPGAPPEWQDFFEKALAADPSVRPTSAQELIEELEAAVVGRPSSPNAAAGVLLTDR